jgi:pimeloyl-ACP methyl ester carboxylesterase
MNHQVGSSASGSGRRLTVWPAEPVKLRDGQTIFVRHAGPARPGLPPAVLVHGLGGSALNWTGLMGELTGELDQWAPDLPGFGESPPGRRHAIDAYVRLVVEYMERFSGPVHLVANSMGGLIAVWIAAHRIDLVSSLSLVSPAMPALRLPAAARGMAVLAMPRLGERLLARINNVTPEEQVRRLANVLFGEPDMVDPAGFELAVRERARRIEQGYGDAVLLEALRSVVRQYIVPPRRSAWAAAKRIRCPTLVLLGGRDTLVGAAAAVRWRRSVPQATVIKLPSTGHVAMMERPELVASLICEHVLKPATR